MASTLVVVRNESTCAPHHAPQYDAGLFVSPTAVYFFLLYIFDIYLFYHLAMFEFAHTSRGTAQRRNFLILPRARQQA